MPSIHVLPPPRSRYAAAILAALWLLLICAATLLPDSAQPVGSTICLLCGDRGLADAVLNLLMFFPFGLFLRLAGVSSRSVAVCCLAASMGIELAQVSAVAGRDATAGDVVFNSLGGWFGAYVVSWRVLLFPTQDRAGKLALLWTIVALLPAALFSISIRRSVDATQYWGQWNAETGSHPPYAGRVLSASLGSTSIPSHQVDSPAIVRWALQTERALNLRFVAAAPPIRSTSLFGIGDEHERQVLWVAIDGEDLLVRWRMRAADLLLDRPTLRLPGALSAIHAGDTVNLRIEYQPRGVRASINDRSVSGPLRTSLSWSLLWHNAGLKAADTAVISAIWVALMAIPGAWWIARSRKPLQLSTIYMIAQFLAPHVFTLAAPELTSWLAISAAMLITIQFHRRFVDHHAEAATDRTAATRASTTRLERSSAPMPLRRRPKRTRPGGGR